MSGGYPRFQGEPVELEWFGWRSNTHRLQHAGWSLSANQNVMDDTMTLALNHPESGIYMISHMEKNWGYRARAMAGGLDAYSGFRQRGMMIDRAGMRGQLYVRQAYSLAELSRFQPVDATPSFTDMAPKALEDLVHFRPLEAKRILLPHEEVDELMARILEVQQPMREEYFRDQARRDAAERNALRFHGQIYSMAA
jgi:hypothetical protein